MGDFSSAGEERKKIVLVAGDHDSYCPQRGITELAETCGAQLQMIEGADHFFSGYEEPSTQRRRSAQLLSAERRRRVASRLPYCIEGIVGVRLRKIDDALDRGAQIAMVDALQRREVVEVVEVDQIVDQHGVVERLLVEVESLQPR